MSGDYFFAGLRDGLLLVLACLLVAAAVTDLRARIISNWLNLAVALMAPLYWWAGGETAPAMALHIALGVGVLAAFAVLFALGMMGGGDVKLLAALALWFPMDVLLWLLIVMSVLGGLVTLVTVIDHRMRRKQGPPEVPYGVAISLAALWVVGQTIS